MSPPRLVASDAIATLQQLFDAQNDRIERLQRELDEERRAHAETRRRLAALQQPAES